MAAPRTATRTATAPTGWNWGAFWLTWIWGIGNRVWIALLALVPFVGIVMAFVLGAKGTEWAWRADEKKNRAEFDKRQRTWSTIGWVVGGLLIFFTILSIVLTAFVFKATGAPTEASREFVSELQSNQVQEAYDDTSSLFKTITTKEKLQSVADVQQKITTGEFKVTERSIDNGQATVKGTLKGKTGSDNTVTITLVKEGDRWVVQGYNIK